MSTFVIATLVILTGQFGAAAPSEPAAVQAIASATLDRPSANLAQGKPYTLNPAPNYGLCTDPGDATQLTDGVYTKGHFWTQLSTVGWQGVGAAISEYAIHRYWTDSLRTHGRYVAFVVTDNPFLFADEVEVYEGAPEFRQVALAGKPIPDIKAHFVATQVKSAILRRFRDDALALRGKIGSSTIPDAQKQEQLKQLDSIQSEAATAAFDIPSGFRAVLPLNPLHQRIFDVQADWWKARGLRSLTAWRAGLWDMLPVMADPDVSAPAAVEAVMMQNEYRAGAINLSNATRNAMTLTLRFDGLPGAPMPDYIRVHEVSWTDTHESVPVAAALPDAARMADGWQIQIPAGMTRQVWFTFHPTSVTPGTYQGQIVIDGAGTTEKAPVSLRIYPLRFPDQPTLHFGGWDYTNAEKQYEVTPQNRTALIAMLREHFVDSPWGTAEALPYGVYDAAGALTTPPDTKNFDTWLERWPNARQYLVFAAVKDVIGGLTAGTEPFNKAVGAWVSFWARHAQEKSVKPEQLSMLIVDEPYNAEQQKLITQWIKAIRAANTGIRIWEDPTFDKAGLADTEMLGLCDTLCPNRQRFLSAADDYRQVFVTQRDRGAQLEFYSCEGPARLLDPYRYYRLQAWTCREYGAKATYFWAFGDGGGASSWNEYTVPNSAFTPLFLDPTSCVTAKELEACREGVEDYEYFVMLEKAIAKARESHKDAKLIENAETLLRTAPKTVCDAGRLTSFQWQESLDRTVADRTRTEMLDALSALAR
ncbi:MAG: hypothetical protein HZB26_00385 [Candidatus Hydrogenedentes bacterium]|nr:hypothetical protein [Candidatus Hydrogenedentota bacterium]